MCVHAVFGGDSVVFCGQSTVPGEQWSNVTPTHGAGHRRRTDAAQLPGAADRADVSDARPTVSTAVWHVRTTRGQAGQHFVRSSHRTTDAWSVYDSLTVHKLL